MVLSMLDAIAIAILVLRPLSVEVIDIHRLLARMCTLALLFIQ